ncbi:MAG: riboflavin synthase, partial [Halomonas sp.]
TLQNRVPGDQVNIEIDPQTQVIVETVERVLAQQSRV